ncbi:hypothetical protein CJ030_MR2G010261 [Morella rubra]|uniref:Uncharacterized protein n=1 Tax=Morella rubra TaxID=262757 RepID=A0A6A1WBJ9_9ROSI|nr:hypothetical protein CJ030_MR2G010261 [Morella rubra]
MSGVKRARTTRTGTGSSSQEQEVADPMMTLERRMEYLRGWPVAKERPVTLSDFDHYCTRSTPSTSSSSTKDFFISSHGLRGFAWTQLCKIFLCTRLATSASKRGRGRTRGWFGEESWVPSKTISAIPEGECGGVSFTAATLSTKIGMLVRGLILISVNKWVDVPAEVKEYIMDWVLDHFDLDYTRQRTYDPDMTAVDATEPIETMMHVERTATGCMQEVPK